MKKKRKTVMYESPVTKEIQVKLESGICAGSYKGEEVNVAGDGDNGEIEGHSISSGSFTFSSSWED